MEKQVTERHEYVLKSIEGEITQKVLQEAHGPHRSPELTAVNMYM